MSRNTSLGEKVTPKQFKRLQATWYRKLKDGGFVDIEDANKDRLKSWTATKIGISRDRENWDTAVQTSQYFHAAQTVLHDFPFKSNRDRKIWTLHCQGLSTRQIANAFGNIDHCTVFQTIKRIRAVFLDVNDIPATNLIKIRKGELSDVDFLYVSWLRPLYHDCNANDEIDRDKFMSFYNKRLTYILARPATEVLVACLAEDPDVIIGYSVIEWRKLWWVYVKKAWREMGIAKKLIGVRVNSCAYVSDTARGLKPKDWDVNPYFEEEIV